jgi:hypothetical protein
MRGDVVKTATVTVDPGAVSVARWIAAMARAAAKDNGPLVSVLGRALDDLAAELGGDEAAIRHLLRVATKTGRPIAVNVPTGAETSTTLFVAPKDWTQQRTDGWVAARHEVLERQFGPVTVRNLEDE